jgi:hypothetical protein
MMEDFKNPVVLLATPQIDYNRYDNELRAVSEVNKEGELLTVEADWKNSGSKIPVFERNGKELEDFMLKLQGTISGNHKYFLVNAGKMVKMKEGLEELLYSGHSSECREMLKKYEVNPYNFKRDESQNQNQTNEPIKSQSIEKQEKKEMQIRPRGRKM